MSETTEQQIQRLTRERDQWKDIAETVSPFAKRMDVAREKAEARVEELEAALRDFRDHGTRFDTNPTRASSQGEADIFYPLYIQRIDKAVRERAAKALASPVDPPRRP